MWIWTVVRYILVLWSTGGWSRVGPALTQCQLGLAPLPHDPAEEERHRQWINKQVYSPLRGFGGISACWTASWCWAHHSEWVVASAGVCSLNVAVNWQTRAVIVYHSDQMQVPCDWSSELSYDLVLVYFGRYFKDFKSLWPTPLTGFSIIIRLSHFLPLRFDLSEI